MIVIVQGKKHDKLTEAAKRLDLFSEGAYSRVVSDTALILRHKTILSTIALDIKFKKITEVDLALVKKIDNSNYKCNLYKCLS